MESNVLATGALAAGGEFPSGQDNVQETDMSRPNGAGPQSGWRRVLRWPKVAVALGLTAVLAASSFASQGSRTTNWVTPVWFPSPAECVWGETHNFGPPHSNNDPGTHSNCIPASTADAFADTTAHGEQIEAYGYAYNSCIPDFTNSTASTASTANDTSFTITALIIKEGCESLMRVDMKPKFRARVEVDPAGSASAAGWMASQVPAINGVLVKVDGNVSSDGGVTSSTWGGSYAGTGINVPIQGSVGGGAVEKVFSGPTVSSQKLVVTATCEVSCNVDCAVTADSSGDWISSTRGEAWVWESRPGVDLHANCPPNCTGYAYWVYDWY